MRLSLLFSIGLQRKGSGRMPVWLMTVKVQSQSSETSPLTICNRRCSSGLTSGFESIAITSTKRPVVPSPRARAQRAASSTSVTR